MSFNLNRVEVIGRLGHEPEMRYTGEGQAVTKFSLATDRPAKAGAQRETDWHQIVCWGKLAEFAGQYLAKGRLVFAAGRLTYRSWEDKDGQKRRTTEIVASELILLDRQAESAERSAEAADEVPFLPHSLPPSAGGARPPALPDLPAAAGHRLLWSGARPGPRRQRQRATPATPHRLPAARESAAAPR